MRRWAYVIALVFGLSLSYDLTRIPVQVSDSLGELLDAQAAPSIAAEFSRSMGNAAYLRPLRIAQIKAVFDASGGRYTLAFRSVHVVLLLLAILLFTRSLRVTTGRDLAAAAFALTVFTGLHTFIGTLREAFPINHFLEMVVFSLIVLNLAQGRHHWLADIAAAVTFVVAALVLESGLLVWVVVAAAWLSGMRGISWRGVAVTTVLLCGYLFARFVWFSTGLPALDERGSGYLLQVLERDELQERFSSNPMPFYAYNVASSFLSVLFAEPRAGVWIAVRDWLAGERRPWVWLAIGTSTVTTVLIAAGAWQAWRRRRDGVDEADRLFFIFAGVLSANAVLSYPYTKDEIVSVAGAFYALAAYAAVRRLLAWAEIRPRRLLVGVLGVVLFITSVGWTMRSAGLHHALRASAFKTRNDWVAVPAQPIDTPAARALIRQLRQDALDTRVVAPYFIPAWEERWFEE